MLTIEYLVRMIMIMLMLIMVMVFLVSSLSLFSLYLFSQCSNLPGLDFNSLGVYICSVSDGAAILTTTPSYTGKHAVVPDNLTLVKKALIECFIRSISNTHFLVE